MEKCTLKWINKAALPRIQYPELDGRLYYDYHTLLRLMKTKTYPKYND
jgi:hypothetical protein